MALNCERCGASLPAGATTCPACGAAVSVRTPPNDIVAAISYLGFAVTGVILLLVESYRTDERVRFHARQSIAFTVAWFAFYIIMSVFIAVMPGPLSGLFRLIANLGYIAFAVVWVYLIYQAYTGNRFRLPIIGDWAEAIPL
jgi:uncharacterized membrane protein